MSEARRSVWADLPQEEVYPGIARQVMQGERQTMVRYVYQPGSVFPVHSHPQEQVTVVVSGEITFDIAGQSVVMRSGEVAVIPAGMPHGAVVTGSDVVETFNSMSPRRDSQPQGGGNGGAR